jgi:hypothetical protein
MKDCQTNSCRLGLFEGCLEAAPQLIFQLYVLLVDTPPIHGLAGETLIELTFLV